MNQQPRLAAHEPSLPLRPPYNQAPFVTEPFISTTRNTRNGRGMFVPVTAVANTPITITHNLGRIVQGMIAVLNNGGADFTPALRFAAGEHSNTKQTIEADAAMTNCLIWLF